MDDETHHLLAKLSLPNVRAVLLTELESSDRDLLGVKHDRTMAEYCWTCKPSWQRFLLDRSSEIDLITYLDSDLFFFADPKPIFDEFGDRSILIMPHQFQDPLRHLEIAGAYNAGFTVFRNDLVSRQCIDHWRVQCLEWCYARHENGRSGDQKYLDDWPTCYSGVHVLQHKGATLGPWNWMNYRIQADNQGGKVDDEQLILFHFHRLKLINSWLALPPNTYGATSRTILRIIYRPYLRSLRKCQQL